MDVLSMRFFVINLYLCNSLLFNMKKIILLLLTILPITGCTHPAKTKQVNTKPVNIPSFSPDSAYQYTEKQVSFGARVPNTPAHDKCAEYLVNELKKFGAEVIEQKANLQAFDGTTLKSENIIGVFNPGAEKRILLFSHWDSRPWADHDPDPKNRKTPVMAANDGASGVGVLLEIARHLAKDKPSVGVDIIFFDSEDYGAPENSRAQNAENSWCLGTQYWAHHPHVPGYTARYGILLDMVGAPQATFYREQSSDYYAQSVVDNVWATAENLGFGNHFINEKGGAITDDHIYVNQVAGIPSIDIIDYNPQSDTGFGSYWHTTHDTMDNVSKETLNAVGTTLIHVIYNEK